MKQISQRGLELIKEYEGFSASIYLCPAGKKTIGYGHVLLENDDFNELTFLTKEQAEKLLLQDVGVLYTNINKLIGCDLNQNQSDAILSFVYNVGIYAFEKSTLLRLINNGYVEAAAGQLTRWVYANGLKLPGLVSRRAREAALFSTKI